MKNTKLFILASSVSFCSVIANDISDANQKPTLREKMRQLGKDRPANKQFQNGYTVLHIMALNCGITPDVKKYMDEHGIPNPLIKDNNGETAEDIAEKNKCHYSVLGFLHGYTLGYSKGGKDLSEDMNNTLQQQQ